MDQITAAGLDIDQGMVLKFKDVICYRPEAIRVMSLLSTGSGLFNRVNAFLFETKIMAAIFYPLGKAFRSVVLKLLGIRYIQNLEQPARSSTRA